jgi:hypothetical protein
VTRRFSQILLRDQADIRTLRRMDPVNCPAYCARAGRAADSVRLGAIVAEQACRGKGIEVVSWERCSEGGTRLVGGELDIASVQHHCVAGAITSGDNHSNRQVNPTAGSSESRRAGAATGSYPSAGRAARTTCPMKNPTKLSIASPLE